MTTSRTYPKIRTWLVVMQVMDGAGRIELIEGTNDTDMSWTEAVQHVTQSVGPRSGDKIVISVMIVRKLDEQASMPKIG